MDRWPVSADVTGEGIKLTCNSEKQKLPVFSCDDEKTSQQMAKILLNSYPIRGQGYVIYFVFTMKVTKMQLSASPCQSLCLAD
jgi:hypothetical protein